MRLNHFFMALGTVLTAASFAHASDLTQVKPSTCYVAGRDGVALAICTAADGTVLPSQVLKVQSSGADQPEFKMVISGTTDASQLQGRSYKLNKSGDVVSQISFTSSDTDDAKIEKIQVRPFGGGGGGGFHGGFGGGGFHGGFGGGGFRGGFGGGGFHGPVGGGFGRGPVVGVRPYPRTGGYGGGYGGYGYGRNYGGYGYGGGYYGGYGDYGYDDGEDCTYTVDGDYICQDYGY